ncbi:hypothetical protein [Streptomyces sp. F-7]|uniref:hypothetical protein n=1 Tax=Streptomyces sp. F-7 TaxID=573566 RepID=UPI000AD98D09|nr:hypothetical protein [Streptomyces sp. F-7]
MELARRQASSHFLDIVRYRDQANNLATAILPSRSRVFGSVSLAIPDIDGAPELAFIRAASWLYVHYFEAGRVSVRFLIQRTAREDEHMTLVHALRTWSQHHLDPTSHRDIQISVTCEQWFDGRCGTRLPRTDEHWGTLLESLLAEAAGFLAKLVELVSAVESAEERDIICQQWEDRLKRNWPAHRYHNVISAVAADIGRNELDPVAFYNRNGQVLRDRLKELSDDCDFETEVRKLVERALLTETARVLPITGLDVMDSFGLGPGPQVGRLLAHARKIYDDQPCSREVLLERMKAEYGESLPEG